MDDFAITVRNLSLKYKVISSASIKRHLSAFKNENYAQINKRTKEITALQDVSFNVRTGEVLGVIGRNGAGKTTLLKTLAGIFQPDHGEVIISKPSISLLTLGAGFELELSGYENIFLSGLLLGFTKRQLKNILNQIIEFSGLGNAIFNPVRSYSSGMRSRLAFSISACIEPDILLIDEILGVGDEEFKEKSEKRIQEFFYSDKTIVFVTHDLAQARELCNSVLWLEKGRVVMQDTPDKTVQAYQEFVLSMK